MAHSQLRQAIALACAGGVSASIGVPGDALAQDAVGGVIGVVKDQGRGFNLAGVGVRLEPIGIRTTTGPDGRFRLQNVPPGTYTLVMTYLGGGETRETITVQAGDIVDIDAEISFTMEEIIVRGARGALASARARERAADQLVTIAAADAIGNFADQNVAESLQRLPGLSIRRAEGEGQQVAIRGLSGSFVTVTVDGARLGTRDIETRSVNLDVVSSDLLDSMEVTKSVTADMDADSVAGNVNLSTVTAFRRGKNSFNTRAEVGYQEKSDDYNPRLSGDFTRLWELGGDRAFGIAGGVSYQNRQQTVDDFRVDDGLRFIDEIDDPNEGPNNGNDDDDTISVDPEELWIRRIDQRNDPAERTRISANLNFDYRPSDSTDLFARFSYAHFEDDDWRARERIEIDDADEEEILAISPTTGIFTDVDFSKRFRYTSQEDDLYTASLGGTTSFRNAWTVSYQVDYSNNDSTTPSLEGRFRERDVRVEVSDVGISGMDFTVLPDPAQNSDPLDPENFDFRFITAYDFFNEDEVVSAKIDFERELNWADKPGSIKFGVKYFERDRDVNVDRATINTDAISSLGDFGLVTPDNTDLNVSFFPNLGEMRRALAEADRNGTRVVDDATNLNANTNRDFTAVEEVLSAYLMGDFDLNDQWKVILGVRVESTDWETTGSVSEVIERNQDATDLLAEALQQAITDGTANFTQDELDAYVAARPEETQLLAPQATDNDYTDVFPNFHLRYEPRDDLVMRFSYTEALVRPDVRQAAAIQATLTEEDVDEDDVEDEINDNFGGVLNNLADADAVLAAAGQEFVREIDDLRVPLLDPMQASQFDLSVSWYPSDNTYLQASLFYKDIEDFIVPVELSGDDVTTIGLPPADGTLTGGFDNVSTFFNGDAAEVSGLELSYAQNFVNLPGFWGGLFFNGNLTFADSEARIAGVSREITLPDQADVIGNATLGWENENWTLRVSGNYIDERLIVINAGRLGVDLLESDEFERDRFSVDFNARWQFSDSIQFYLDAINLNDAEDRRFFQGNARSGSIFSQIENYGATYQLGVRVNFEQ